MQIYNPEMVKAPVRCLLGGCHVMLMTPILVYREITGFNFAIPASNIEINCLATSVVNQSSDQLQSLPARTYLGSGSANAHQRIIAINGADVPPYERMSRMTSLFFSIMAP